MKKILIILLLLLNIIIILSNNIIKASTDEKSLENNYSYVSPYDNELVLKSNTISSIVMEVDTKQVLYSNEENVKRPPASLTKLLTMDLVLEALSNNKIKLDDIVVTSKLASSMGGSQIFLQEGEKMCVNDLFKSMVIASANDAAVALAEKVDNSVNEFVRHMNEYSTTLGCKNSNFVNPTGLPEDNHETTAYDLALIACDILSKYEDTIIPYSSCYEDYIRTNTSNPFWLVNTNKLIKTHHYIDGLKTGWTKEAGYCLCATGRIDNMRLVCVVMNCKTIEERNEYVVSLLNRAFNTYKKTKLISKDEVIKEVSNVLSIPSKYSIIPSNDVYYVCDKTIKEDNFRKEIQIYNEINTDDEVVGKICVFDKDQLIGYTNLIISTKVHKTSFIKLFLDLIKSILF